MPPPIDTPTLTPASPAQESPPDMGGLGALLESVAEAFTDAVGFGTVVINLHRPEWDDYQVVAVAGRQEAREALLGATYPASDWEELLHSRFELGGAYFIPAGSMDWDDAPSFVPDLPADGTPDAWHPEDALFVPLRGADGHLLGVVSVDEPASGRRPTAESIQGLVGLANHSSLTIQAAQAGEAAARHRAALAQLFRISAKLNDDESLDDVLQTVCDAIHEALGFQLVVVETPDRTTDRYRARAAAGAGYDPGVLEIDVPVGRFQRVYDPEFEVEGCYLLPREEALVRAGADAATYHSQLNGRGSRAWNRHWLIVPLVGAGGEEIGFIWADDPADRLLPSRERLQALRLFADSAQRALISAEQMEALREAGERHRTLFQASPTGIVVTDTEGRVRDLNDAARRLYGFEDDDLVGKVPPWMPDPEGYLGRYAAYLRNPRVQRAEWVDQRSDGSTIYVDDTSAPLRDADGAVTGVVSTLVDVTAERRAQEEVARQKAEVEALYDTTLALIDRVDLESVLQTIVTRAENLVGADGGYLYLVDPDLGVARPTVTTGVFTERLYLPIARGEGLAGRVWETGEQQVVDDYGSWEGRLVGLDDARYHAVAGVPIVAGGEVVGVLGVGCVQDGRTFTDAERGLLIRFSHLASLAFGKARLYAKLEEQNAALEALHETALNLVHRLDSAGTLQTIVERAKTVTGSESAFLYLAEDDVLVPAVAVGSFVKRDRWLRSGEGLSGRVWETGEPLLVQSDEAWAAVGGSGDALVHAVAAVPIAGESGVVGVLGIGVPRGERCLVQADVSLLVRFSHLASLALQNAKLYEALSASEEMYRRVVENATDLISLIDLEGFVVYASPSHERVLGWPPDELVGRPIADVVHPDEVEALAETMARGEPTGPIRVRHRDGRYLFLEGTPAPLLGPDGTPEGMLAVSRDVTDRVHADEARAVLEEQLRQSQKMEAIGRLAGGVAHDFNNLLTAIGGYAELAVDQVDEASPARRSLREISRAADRAADLTKQLLAYSRKQVLQPKVVDVNDVVRGMGDILARLLGAHIALETELDERVGTTRVDPGQLEQVVMNLAINSRDAMPTGGRLVVRTRGVVVEGSPHVLLEVEDTGCGMDGDTLALAFEPFFTTKDVGEGTGLGLSTVYGIVAQTGGRVDADSEPGEGTRVRVYLPRVEGERDQPSQPEQPSAEGAGTILLVEDEELVRDLVRELLTASGYTVLCAANGAAALELAAAHDGRLDALVTDVVMPGMSGQQVAARLLAEHPKLRVLFTSGYAEDAIATHGELTPGAAFLGKPFRARDLAEKLRELLERPV